MGEHKDVGFEFVLYNSGTSSIVSANPIKSVGHLCDVIAQIFQKNDQQYAKNLAGEKPFALMAAIEFFDS